MLSKWLFFVVNSVMFHNTATPYGSKEKGIALCLYTGLTPNSAPLGLSFLPARGLSLSIMRRNQISISSFLTVTFIQQTEQ